MGLNDDFTGALGAAGTPSHLNDQLGQPFGGAKVDAEQAGVGVDDADQGDIGQMVALGQHLGADENPPLAAVSAFQQGFHRAFAASAVAIHPHQADTGKTLGKLAFHPFRALAQRAQPLAAAAGAAIRDRALVTAVMAAKLRVAGVQGQAGIAAIAGGDPAAFMAKQGGGEAATVEEYQHLTVPFQMLPHAP